MVVQYAFWTGNTVYRYNIWKKIYKKIKFTLKILDFLLYKKHNIMKNINKTSKKNNGYQGHNDFDRPEETERRPDKSSWDTTPNNGEIARSLGDFNTTGWI